MKTRTTLSLSAMVAAVLLLGAQCKKGGDAGGTTGEAAPPPPAPADTGAAGPESGEVTTYPNMVPQGGTVRLLQSFQVRQAADPNSKLLTGLSAGTLVDLKNSYGNWMMIMWPSGVGQLSPGWIELRSVNDNRVTQVTRDAGRDAAIVDAAPDVAVVPDAAVPDAARPLVDGGIRLRLPPPKKTPATN